MSELTTYRVVQNAQQLNIKPEDAVSDIDATRIDFSPNTLTAVLYVGEDVVGMFQNVVKVCPVSSIVAVDSTPV